MKKTLYISILMTLPLIALKLFGIITWSWWAVTLPLWITPGIIVLGALVFWGWWKMVLFGHWVNNFWRL